MTNFKVGDTVVVKDNYLDYEKGLELCFHSKLSGLVGIVVGTYIRGTKEYVTVEFSEEKGCFHDANGLLKNRRGYWLAEEMLELVNNLLVDLL